MTASKKNQYEDLIDQMMIEEVSGLDQEIAATLRGLSTNKKRMAILSILDKDRDMFLKIKNTVKDNQVSKTEHIKNVVEMMRSYVKVGEVEKKTLGEVMTPISLVNDMMNTLPADVWLNPTLKWLDPCSGVGIFSCVIVERLMEGLKEFEQDEELRYKHIVENMIYVGELQPKNMFLFLCAFDPNDEYALNVYTGSFLDENFDNHMKDIWELDKFDIIVQNPPYQTNNEGEKKTHPIWDKFVNKALDNTKNNGFMVAVHPDGWRAVEGRFKDIQKLLCSNEIIYLELHNRQDGVNTFGVQTTYDFYCVRKKVNEGFESKIKGQDGSVVELDLKNVDFIPNGMFNDIYTLVAKPGEEKVEVLYSRSNYGTDKANMSKEQTEEFKYPCVYTVLKDSTVNKFYSNTNEKGHFGIPKVIWSNGISSPISDSMGKYGLTQFSYAIVDEVENIENIKKAISSDKFVHLIGMSDGLTGQGGGHRYNKKVMSTFRKDFWKEFL